MGCDYKENNLLTLFKIIFLTFGVNCPAVLLIIALSAVNNLSGLTKLTTGSFPLEKSDDLMQIAVLLEYGFEVI